MQDYAAEREAMVQRQVEARGVSDPRVLSAMRRVPRHRFVPMEWEEHAYDDSPLPIGADQTISQPYIVALMIEAAAIDEGSDVLEIGAGSGYAAAVIGQIAHSVIAVERHEALASCAANRMDALGYHNVRVVCGDGMDGWPSEAPFDAIIVSAAGRGLPPALPRQLKVGGRLVIPLEDGGFGQSLISYRRTGETDFESWNLGDVRFVPLLPGVRPSVPPGDIS